MCLFCKIAAKETPAEIIYEDGSAVAFLDINPRAPGHTLVIPKVHATNLLELPETDIGPYFSAVKETVLLIAKGLRPDGFTLGINHGLVSGQEVMHLHVHIVPRWAGDGGRSLQNAVDNPPTEDIKTIGGKIRRGTVAES